MGNKPVYKPTTCRANPSSRKRRKPHRKVNARAVRARKRLAVHSAGASGLVTCDPASSEEKIGRNARCPCGSGLKHKHCCLRD
jgi:hypothetical protein